MARTCPACGRANDDDASFCQECGSAVEGTTEARRSSPQPPPAGSGAPDRPAAGPPPGGRRAATWLVVLVVAVVIAVIAAAALLLFPRGESRDAGDQSPAPSAGATVGVSPSPALGRYLAGAVGAKADRLAAIGEDGTVRPLADFGDAQVRTIAYAPDGKWLACVAGTHERSELWLFDTATGDARQATADTPDVLAVDSVAWLSATELLVAGYTEPPRAAGQNADLLVYDITTRRFSPLLDAGGVSLRGVAVSASREGAEVAFVSYTDVKAGRYGTTGKEHLRVLDRASGTVTELDASKAFFDVNARAFDEPLISPSGEALIYRRAGSDVGTSYTVVGADGGILMPAKEAQYPAGYAWDPDGTRVVFTGVPPRRFGRLTFWVFDTETGDGPVVLARHKGVFVQDLSWSPDGETIAWAAYDEDTDHTGTIYLMPAAGGETTAFAERALSPVWAPSAAPSLQTSPSP
ncbi:MAG: zinc-ribbon domain-containing protein [Deltaproteobacteria bacterium]